MKQKPLDTFSINMNTIKVMVIISFECSIKRYGFIVGLIVIRPIAGSYTSNLQVILLALRLETNYTKSVF